MKNESFTDVKYTMKYISYLLLLLLSVVSCSTPSHQELEQKVQYIPYNGNSESIYSGDIFKTISFIPLETNDTCLLGTASRIIYKNAIYYIKSNNRIYLFDDKGDIIRIINRHGDGPEEYNYFWMMAVSDKGHISLIQRGEFSIITYNSYGNFISRLKLDTIKARDLKYLNDSILITKSDFERNGNKYHVINMNNSTIENSLYPISYREHRIAMKDCMTAYQGKILTCDYHSNEIHEITKDSVSIKYIFNINGKMPPAGYWDNNQIDYLTLDKDYEEKGYIGDIPCFVENDKAILFRFHGMKEGLESFAYINKLTGQIRTFDTIILADGLSVKPTFFHAQDNGKLIFAIEPISILESGNEELKAKFPDLEEDSNPVLLYVELN